MRCSTLVVTKAAAEFEAIAEHAHQRLRAVLPRSLDAAAGTPSRGLSAAGPGVLAGARARGLPTLPRPGPPARGLSTVSDAVRGRPVLSSTTAFVADPAGRCSTESGRPPAFLCQEGGIDDQLADRYRRAARREEPEVEVLLAEVARRSRLRVFIDHPDGVTLELCERVTRRLHELRERYSLEVSSPGVERPLTKPAHFRRFVGRRARVRTRRPPDPSAPATRQLHRRARRRLRRGGHAGRRRGRRSRSPTPRSVVRTSSRSSTCHAKSLRRCTRWRARRASSPRS